MKSEKFATALARQQVQTVAVANFSFLTFTF